MFTRFAAGLIGICLLNTQSALAIDRPKLARDVQMIHGGNASLDSIGGYGNSWHDLLAYRVAMADPGSSAAVSVSATFW